MDNPVWAHLFYSSFVRAAVPPPIHAPHQVFHERLPSRPPHFRHAGHDTKIFMNSTEAPSKRSYIERTVDRIILMFFCVLLIW